MHFYDKNIIFVIKMQGACKKEHFCSNEKYKNNTKLSKSSITKV